MVNRTQVLFAVLLFASLSALAQPARSGRFANPLLDDVVQMTRAQLPEQTILAFLRARQTRLETDVTADDLARLHRAGVSDRVVSFIAGVSGLDDRSPRRSDEPRVADDSDGSSPVPMDPGDDSGADVAPEPYGPDHGGW